MKSGEIAIPEIQRPFVWEPIKVRNLLDSLYQGYPVGYLTAWRNPNIRLKDGTISAGKKILIDGQQRVTALMAALMGHTVLSKNYETVRIRISFNPIDEKFEVANPAIQKNQVWIYDVADVFHPEASITELTENYTEKNPGCDRWRISKILEKLRKIVNNLVGIIDLAEDLDIETVTEIFIRVNSAGAELSQADFAMSKIAANETYGGHELRKAIDYFCHLSIAPEFYQKIKDGDPKFAATDYFAKMSWLKTANDDIYIERIVRRWYVMSLLTGQYAGNPETAFDLDIRQIDNQGLKEYTDSLISARLSESFWETLLPQQMETSSAISPYFLVFKAAQAKMGDKGFLSRDITVRDLLLNRSDIHHIFPKSLLKKDGLQRSRYNQIANYAITQSEINIAIGEKEPAVYFAQLAEQLNGGPIKYGGINSEPEMLNNFIVNCILPEMLNGNIPPYNDFLKLRRQMSKHTHERTRSQIEVKHYLQGRQIADWVFMPSSVWFLDNEGPEAV